MAILAAVIAGWSGACARESGTIGGGNCAAHAYCIAFVPVVTTTKVIKTANQRASKSFEHRFVLRLHRCHEVWLHLAIFRFNQGRAEGCVPD